MLGFFASKNKHVRVGVDFMSTGVAVAVVSAGKEKRGQVKTCEFLAAVGHTEQAKALHSWVDQNQLQNAECFSLIARHDVQLLQLEKPAVEDAELLQAVRWKITDLINYEIDAAVVDVFQLPPSPKSPVSYINAVVANEAVVSRYVDSVRQSGLKLVAIDVHDLVTKNYCRIFDLSESTVAILQLSDKAGQVSIYHNQDLYVARDFKIGLLDLESSEDDESTFDALLLELQRSMDYFESTYGLGMVQQMLIFPHTGATSRMAKYVQNYVGFDLGFVDVSVEKNSGLEQIEAHCFAAYCAALRGVNL
jgi:MSHA biogenesis protein MshI